MPCCFGLTAHEWSQGVAPASRELLRNCMRRRSHPHSGVRPSPSQEVAGQLLCEAILCTAPRLHGGLKRGLVWPGQSCTARVCCCPCRSRCSGWTIRVICHPPGAMAAERAPNMGLQHSILTHGQICAIRRVVPRERILTVICVFRLQHVAFCVCMLALRAVSTAQVGGDC